MKTAGEILDEYGCPEIPFDENVTMYYPNIIAAMEVYAKEYNKTKLKEMNEMVKWMRG